MSAGGDSNPVGPIGRLAGRRAVVTGGERGIGKAIALRFAAEGADVAITFVDSEAAAAAVVTEMTDAGRQACAIRSDFTEPGSIAQLHERLDEDFGPVDILVNNAAVIARQPFMQTTAADFSRTLDVNLVAPYLLAQQFARRLATAGSPGCILNITSVSQQRAAPGLSAYQCAKAGLWMLTRGLALELAEYAIRVNSIAPGTTVTELSKDLLSDPERRAAKLSSIPLGRLASGDDHAGAAVFLCSDDAGWVTGSCLVVDGGFCVA
jgi:NAD(P)-dependent dehydrogenase (short-subunit alcohol dehydrogenase family)